MLFPVDDSRVTELLLLSTLALILCCFISSCISALREKIESVKTPKPHLQAAAVVSWCVPWPLLAHWQACVCFQTVFNLCLFKASAWLFDESPLFLCGVSISRHVDSRPQRRFRGLMTVWLGVCVFCRPSSRMSFTRSWSSAPDKLRHFYKHLEWAEQAWECLQILGDSMQHAPGILRTQLLISRRSAEAVPIMQLSSNCVTSSVCFWVNVTITLLILCGHTHYLVQHR